MGELMQRLEADPEPSPPIPQAASGHMSACSVAQEPTLLVLPTFPGARMCVCFLWGGGVAAVWGVN